jgi:hypothetical protein
MKNQIPKYILDALDKRQKYAEEFLKYDLIISNYCLKNNIDTEYVNASAICIGEPDAAKRATIEDIQNQLNK